MNVGSQRTTCHATLTEALYAVLEDDVGFQQRVLQHITARVCRLDSAAGTDSDGHNSMAQAPPPWGYRDDYRSSPQGVYAVGTPPSRAEMSSSPLSFSSVELLWRLDVFHVAQTAPSTAGALLNAPCAAVNASASAALQSWLVRHHAQHQQQSRAVTDPAAGAAWENASGDGGRNIDRAVERAESDAAPTSWPPAWWAALEGGEVECVVRVVLLRVPTAYATFHAASGGPPGAETGVRVAGAAAPFTYPADAFLEAAPVLHVMGVVHRVFYESRSTSSPAPWLTLLPLQSDVAAPSCFTVDLTSLSRATVDAVAVLGTVVELRGYTRVAQRPTRAGRSAGRREGEAMLAEYVVASWAAVVCASDTARDEDSAVVSPPSLPQTHQSSPDGVGATQQQHPWCGEALHDVFGSDCLLEEGLPAGAEDAAARAALSSWAGARLALGVRDVGGDGHDTAWPTTPLFSVSPDVVIAAQLALLSAQLSDGVVVLLADGAPESVLSQIMQALRTAAPTTAVEVSPELLCRAAPSTLLPSYRVQNVPTAALPPPPPPPQSSHVPPMSRGSVKSVARGLQGPPRYTAPHPRGRARGFAAAAAAPPPLPCFAEVLCGGVLSRAGGRALVLQGLELMPPPTLAVLREAWRPRGGAEAEAEAAEEMWGGQQNNNNNMNNGEDVISVRSGGVLQLEREMSTPLRCVPPSLADDGRHVIQREGGQRVRYRVAHAALCSVRQPSRLTERSHLVEFAQRCDVVLRPAYDQGRQAAAAVHAGVTAPFQRLLQRRRASWLQLLGQTFALPAAGEEVVEGRDVAPTLTEACSRLLSTYFIAAKAVCEAGTDASMMTTLVKLTVTHARWRRRLTHLRQQQQQQQRGMCSVEPSDAVPVTALVDAVVAVGLCDATLHFFTATTLLGECVLRLLEREAWASWEGGAAEQTAEMALGEGEEAELCSSVPPEVLPEVRELYTQVEFRTRVGVASRAEQHDGAAPQPSSSFSMRQLVDDLVGHLERMSHPTAPSMEA